MDPAKTVFISSRTEELANERRAAYEAVAAAGLYPLIFDASLNRLRDIDIPMRRSSLEGERRRATDRILRDQVDALIGQSDLFVGIYYRTIGPPQEVVGQSAWLQYELIRFLTRHIVTKEHLTSSEIIPRDQYHLLTRKELENVKGDVEKETSAWMRAGGHRRHREVLYSALKGKVDSPLRTVALDIARDRIFLFTRQENRDWIWDGDLQTLLDPFIKVSVVPFQSHLEKAKAPETDYCFIPADAQLFRSLHEQCKRFSDDQVARESSQAPEPLISFHLSDTKFTHDQYYMLNQPGVLSQVLRSCFQAGLDVQLLLVQHPRDCDKPPIRGWAKPYRTPVHDGQRTDYHEKLRDSFKGLLDLPFEIGSVARPTGSESKVIRREEHRKGEWSYAYKVRFVDVPGSLWSIVSLITAYHGNISYFTYDADWDSREDFTKVGFEPHNRIVEIQFGIKSEEGHEFSRRIKMFEYQLKCMSGYISSSFVKD